MCTADVLSIQSGINMIYFAFSLAYSLWIILPFHVTRPYDYSDVKLEEHKKSLKTLTGSYSSLEFSHMPRKFPYKSTLRLANSATVDNIFY